MCQPASKSSSSSTELPVASTSPAILPGRGASAFRDKLARFITRQAADGVAAPELLLSTNGVSSWTCGVFPASPGDTVLVENPATSSPRIYSATTISMSCPCPSNARRWKQEQEEEEEEEAAAAAAKVARVSVYRASSGYWIRTPRRASCTWFLPTATPPGTPSALKDG